MKKPTFKISCEYYIYANDKNEVIDFIANENDFVETHISIEEVNGIDEDDIYNNYDEVKN